MIKVKTAFFATDEQDSEVLVMPGYQITEITDAGPVFGRVAGREQLINEIPTEWLVAFRITVPGQWSEIVTCDAIKLLKALE